jgi:hypothetical protein
MLGKKYNMNASETKIIISAFAIMKIFTSIFYMGPDPYLGSWIRVRFLIHQIAWIWIYMKRMKKLL